MYPIDPTSSLHLPERLQAVNAVREVRSEAEPRLARLTHLAQALLRAEAVAVVIVDHDHDEVWASVGDCSAWERRAPRVTSPACFAVAQAEPVVVEDADEHPWFEGGRGSEIPGAFLALPMRDEEGHIFGALVVGSPSERVWTQANVDLAADLAELAVSEIRLRVEIAERRIQEVQLRRTAAVVRSTEDGVVGCDFDGRITLWNLAAERMLGRKADEVMGHFLAEILPADEAEALREGAERIIGGERSASFELIQHEAGREATYAVSMSPVRADSGHVTGWSAILRDVTEIRSLTSALKESQRSLFTLMSNLPGMAYRCRPQGENWITEFVSDGCRELTGYSPEVLIGDRMLASAIFVHPEDQARVWEELTLALQEQRPYRLLYRIRAADGEEKWVWEQGEGIRDESGALVTIEGLITDITERKRAEDKLREQEAILARQAEELRALSLVDELTGLYNRRGFNTLAEQQIKAALRTDKEIVLLFADMDGLKWINDNLGHKEGDEALMEMGQLLKSTFRDSDIVARLAGDEFVVLALEAPGNSGERLVEKLEAAVQKANVDATRAYPLAVSTGLARYDRSQPQDLEALLAEADEKMYAAKQERKRRAGKAPGER